MSRKRRSFFGTLIFILFVSIVCIGFLFIGNKILGIPDRAMELYGKPSQALSPLQHYQLSFRLIAEESLLLTPKDLNGEQIFFSIEIGESISSILGKLDSAGLISDQEALRNYLIYSGLDTQLQAGKFILSSAMSSIEIINVMMDATPQIIDFNILPGWRIEEIAESLSTSGLAISKDEFFQAANARPSEVAFVEFIPLGVSLEGYMIPGAYTLDRNVNADELILAFLKAFEEQVTMDLLGAFSRQGLTLHQAVTLASVVERESILDEEQPMIASVFLNRLAIDMALESDPTVQYALGFNELQNTWWTNPLSSNQLEIDSLFNTYRYPGLMPGPIANPTLSALQAVGYPAETPYYFFRAACDNSGRHNFSQTFEEHLAFGCP